MSFVHAYLSVKMVEIASKLFHIETMTNMHIFISLTCFLASFFAIKLAIPVLTRIAAAKVNDRSAHTGVVPQGAGLIIFSIVFLATLFLKLYTGGSWFMVQITGLALALSAMGFVDDMKGLPILVRLLGQGVVVALGLYVLNINITELTEGKYRFVFDSNISSLFKFLFYFIIVISLINIFNFMDGMDLMLVTQVISVLIFQSFLLISPFSILVIVFIAFAYFNKPKAKIFLGDSGSLPLGFIFGIIISLNMMDYEAYSFFTAFIFVLYFIADTGITLLKRIYNGERFWEGHKKHFYQLAMQNGQSVWSIIFRIFLFNIFGVLMMFFLAQKRHDIADKYIHKFYPAHVEVFFIGLFWAIILPLLALLLYSFTLKRKQP